MIEELEQKIKEKNAEFLAIKCTQKWKYNKVFGELQELCKQLKVEKQKAEQLAA